MRQWVGSMGRAEGGGGGAFEQGREGEDRREGGRRGTSIIAIMQKANNTRRWCIEYRGRGRGRKRREEVKEEREKKSRNEIVCKERKNKVIMIDRPRDK